MRTAGKTSKARAGLLAISAAVLAGCGYVGDPMPPALLIPMPPQQLSAQQQGGRLLISFQYSNVTTDGLAFPEWSEAEVRVGPMGSGEFQTDAWASGARRVPVTSLAVAVPVRLEAPIAEFAGQEIVCAVRAAGPKGRWSAWSNLVTLRVIKPLPKPERSVAEASAEGVRLTWQVSEPEAGTVYRISRQAPGQEELQTLVDTPASPYTDKSAEYGKEYRYQIRTVLKQGDREVESDASDIVTITPIDTFAPATPVGLSSILGVNSIELSWDRNTEADFRGYLIYRAVGDGAFTRLGGPVESPAFSDKTIEPGRAYRYAISAVDGAGNESPRSPAIAVTAPQ